MNGKKRTKKGTKYAKAKDQTRESKRGKASRDSIEEKQTDSGTIIKSSYSNDPSWYNRAGNLTQTATNISTYTPIGLAMQATFDPEFTPAGIMRLDYIPHFGDLYSPTQPFSFIARDLYDFVNSRNSRSSSYDPNDLMIYCIAVAQAWSFYQCIARIVGMYNTYSVLNRYWFDGVLASMGVAPITSTSSITDWVDAANYIALRLNALAVPKDLTYFQRAMFLNEAVYADSVTEKASLFYYLPRRILRYQYDDEGKSYLTSIPTPFYNSNHVSRTITPDVMLAFFETLTGDLFNDTDISYMKADIVKAFDENGLFRLPQIDRNFQRGFYYDGFVNLQTRNATVMDTLVDYQYTITQDMDTNILVSNKVSTYLSDSGAHNEYGSRLYATTGSENAHLFDFPVDQVSNDMWTEATKLHAYFTRTGRFKATSEVIVRDVFYCFSDVDEPNKLYAYANCINNRLVAPNDTAPYNSIVSFLIREEMASKCAASPIQWSFLTNSPSFMTGSHSIHLNDDLTNYTDVDSSAMDKITDAAQTSLFSWRDLSAGTTSR